MVCSIYQVVYKLSDGHPYNFFLHAGDAFCTDGRSQEIPDGVSEAEDKDDDGLFSTDGLFTATRGSAVNRQQSQPANKQGKWSPIHIWHRAGNQWM